MISALRPRAGSPRARGGCLATSRVRRAVEPRCCTPPPAGVRGRRCIPSAEVPGQLGSIMSDIAADPSEVRLVGSSAYGAPTHAWSSSDGSELEQIKAPCADLATQFFGLADDGHQFALCSHNPGRGAMDKELFLDLRRRRAPAPDLRRRTDLGDTPGRGEHRARPRPEFPGPRPRSAAGWLPDARHQRPLPHHRRWPHVGAAGPLREPLDLCATLPTGVT